MAQNMKGDTTAWLATCVVVRRNPTMIRCPTVIGSTSPNTSRQMKAALEPSAVKPLPSRVGHSPSRVMTTPINPITAPATIRMRNAVVTALRR